MSQEEFKSTFIRQILKFLKIFLHTFLYVKCVYPKETFERVRIFGTFGWYSKSYVLQDYVQQILYSLYHMLYEEKLRLIVIELFDDLNQNNGGICTSHIMSNKSYPIVSTEANMHETNNARFIHNSKSFILIQFDHFFCKGNSMFRTILNYYCIHQTHFFKKHDAFNEDSSYNNEESIEKHMYHCFVSEDSEFVASFRTALNSLLKQQTFDMGRINKIPLSFSIAIQGTDDFINNVSFIGNMRDAPSSKLLKSLILSNWILLASEMLNKVQNLHSNDSKEKKKTIEDKKKLFGFPDNWVQEILITLRGGGLVENIGIPFCHISLFNVLDA